MTTILVVDDEEGIVRILSGLSKHLMPQAVIYEARNSQEAFDAIGKDRIDFLVLDLNLNERLNGYHILQKAREQNPALETLVITGDVRMNIEEHRDKYGIKFIVEKPVKVSKLKEIFIDFLKIRR